MINAGWHEDLVRVFDFDYRAKTKEFDGQNLGSRMVQFNDDVLDSQVAIYSSNVGNRLKKLTDGVDNVYEMDFSVIFHEHLVKNWMRDLIIFYNFRRIEVDVPKQIIQAIALLKLLLAIIDDPNVEAFWLV